MTGTLAILYLTMLFMLIAAVIAVESRDLLSSVLCLGAVGFGLSVADLVLSAPDLALTQLIVEIFVVVLLIRTAVARVDTTQEFVRDTAHVAFMGAVTTAIVAGVFLCFLSLSPFGDPPMIMGQSYMRAAEQAGAGNVVTTVMLGFRTYGTLAEAAIIMAAILGSYALLRDRGKD